MEKVILQQNKHWNEPYRNLIDRSLLRKLVKRLELKEIQVLLGIRRSGKSSIFKLLINYLMEKVDSQTILYVNLDDPYYTEVYSDSINFYRIVEISEKLTGKPVEYLFLDEIQNVKNWEKYVKSVYDSEQFQKIFITGSNSSLLKGEYAQLLSGRYLIEKVSPFSFSEIIYHMNIKNYLALTANKAKVMALVDRLLEFGSYPEIYKTQSEELKRELLIGYYETIVLKDCIANARIREVRAFQDLTYYLLSNAATLYSYNSLAKNLNINENTTREFINVLENSFLIKEVRNFSYSLKKQSKARKKAYVVDNGFLANISFRFSTNRGKLFENLVFSELIKSAYEIYFYHNKYECDFIVKKNNRLVAIQACFELNDQNRRRELNGIREAMAKLGVPTGFIITYDQEEVIDGIKSIPFRKYFSKL